MPPPSAQVALQALREAFDIGQWVHLRIDKGQRLDCPAYAEPVPPTKVDTAALQKESKDALEKLAQREAQLQKLLADLEEERRSAKQPRSSSRAPRRSSTSYAPRARRPPTSSIRTRRRPAIGSSTRRSSRPAGTSGRTARAPSKSARRCGSRTMPTESREGKADYVLWGDNGKPLAVIEAKKTANDAEGGPEQARMLRRRPGEGDRPAPRHLLHERQRHLDLERRAGRAAPQALRLLLQGQPRIPALPARRTRSRSPTRPEPEHRRAHVPARGHQAGGRAVRSTSTARR